jgi:hypothetical protein
MPLKGGSPLKMLREGMRRIGLVTGALGFCAGVLGSYFYVELLLQQRAESKPFQSLLSSPVVAKDIEFLKFLRAATPDWPALPAPQELGKKVKQKYPGSYSSVEDAKLGRAVQTKLEKEWALNSWAVNDDGIKAIHFDGIQPIPDAAHISYIETSEGHIVYRSASPQFWSYLPAIGLPFLGFLLPWGLIRTLTWIGTGFAGTATKGLSGRQE